jgi:hypothetical protein
MDRSRAFFAAFITNQTPPHTTINQPTNHKIAHTIDSFGEPHGAQQKFSLVLQ